MSGMAKLRTIGIDLGTANTVVAEVDARGHSRILRTTKGESFIPSIVYFADHQTFVGREAQSRGRNQPDRVAACAKRMLGQPFYDARIGGELIPPEVIQACILAAAKEACLGKSDQDCRVVIAVPAHFSENQRHATAMAAEMAGLNLLDLVNEPVAAALAFTEGTPFMSLAQPIGGPAAVLVFDLGGYTFEATVLSVRPGQMTMVASEHDSLLGGHEWDLRLADLIVEQFLAGHGIDLRQDPQHLEQLIERVGHVKQALGIRSHAVVQLTVGNHNESIEVKRQEFERVTADLLQRIGCLCDQVLARSQISWRQLHQVMLVGGATRMPMIRQLLRERLGRQPSDLVSPEEAVARGAAIYAARAIHGKRPPSLQVTSYSLRSLGLEELDEQTGERFNKIVLPKGTPLPATASYRFAVGGNHQSLAFTVLEGECIDPAECLTVGRIFLRELPPDSSGDWRLTVTYHYSASGRLNVDVRVGNSHTSARLELSRPGGVSEAHLVRWRPVVNSQAGFAAYREVRAWEEASQAAPPVAVAGLPSSDPDGRLAFLGRLMPFFIRRAQPIATQHETCSPE